MSTNLRDLDDEAIIRAFTIKLSEKHENTNWSKERVFCDTAFDFRDDFKVNVPRIIDDMNYKHPDRRFWSLGPFPQSFIDAFDPVTEEDLAPGGDAHFEPGDLIVIDNYVMLVIDTDDKRVYGMNNSCEIGQHPLPVVRDMFDDEEYETYLVRDDEIVR